MNKFKMNLKSAVLFELAAEQDIAYLDAMSLKSRDPQGTPAEKVDQMLKVHFRDQYKRRADLLTLAALGEEVEGINSLATRCLFSGERRNESDIHRWIREVVIPRYM